MAVALGASDLNDADALGQIAKGFRVHGAIVTRLRDIEPTARPTDNKTHRIHAHTMDTEEAKDTTDELYVLGFIAGLCNQDPRDQLLLDDMLLFLREAQEVRA
jgi:hypothetical protein